MAVSWTEEQQRVIDTRDCNILVSAAAGSGKTAVLVARILSMVTDEKNPVDIDRLLVVTFTNAAAAEMRERIRDALEKRAEEEPDNVHLQKQLVLVHNARITTIHSFCLNVLRSHFQAVGIDPSFRIADEGEILLLEQDAAKETVDAAYEWYAQNRKADANAEDFTNFLESFASGRTDRIIEELILQLYHFALGQPWSKKWLEECRNQYKKIGRQGCSAVAEETVNLRKGDASEEAAKCEQSWLTFIIEDTRHLLSDIEKQVHQALSLASDPDGPYPYLPALESDLEKIELLKTGKDYASFSEAFQNMGSFARLSTKKDERISPEKKQAVQNLRAQVKDGLASIRDKYYYDSQENLMRELQESGTCIRVLTYLTGEFMERLEQMKSVKNVVDFGDLEHLALQVLVDPETGAPTAAAQEYAELFVEIMTDEYQDSNLVQELILNSVSGRGTGASNRFMVGDVKQSIYRFRLARPELFMEKYRTYRNAGKDSCRIDLHRNFRSRAQVLESVNEIFRQVMTENPGQIVYDADAALYPGAVFEPRTLQSSLPLQESTESDSEVSLDTKTHILSTEKQGLSGESTLQKTEIPSESAIQKPEILSESTLQGQGLPRENALREQELSSEKSEERDPFLCTELLLMESDSQSRQMEEAKLVGQRILEIVGKELIWDKELGIYRPAQFRDIVILLRTVSGWAETFSEVLGDMGIPCFTGSQKGYFSAVEIRTVLSYLQILDNPIQDIPLAAAMHSPIGGFDEEDLAKIRIFGAQSHFYDCAQEYRKNGPEGQLKEKLEQFFGTMEYLRGKSGHTPMHLLLWEILDVTGYGDYAASLPAGDQRRANLDMLVEKAIAYEATSYRGLYHFVRYIENLKKYEVDYGEANTDSESADTVRIMSIHKSKGLEFPVVFVSGMGKVFNETDIRSRVILHPEFGIGCDYVDLKNRTRSATLLKKVIQQKTKAENLGEEMRVLYVAMTRAKEKLILTGAVTDLEKMQEKWSSDASYIEETLSYSCLTGASTYLDWVMPCLLRRNSSEETLFTVRYIDAQETTLQEQQKKQEQKQLLDRLLNLPLEECFDEQTAEYLQRVFASVYPHEQDGDIPGKMSVSELKKLSHIPEEESILELYQPEEVVPLIPQFRSGEETLTGAARGTVYHAFMEFLDFSRPDELQLQLEELISCGKMTPEEGQAVNFRDIRRFLDTETAKEMAAAAKDGRLFREQPFVLGVSADAIRAEWNPQETVLVQGIIDAYYVDEDGQIVILDYKTDRVRAAAELAEKYRAQLDYYAMALQRLTGRKVRSLVIYSFHLGKEIFL